MTAGHPVSVPTLDAIAGDPMQAAGLPVEVARALLARCVLAQGVLVARLLEAVGDGVGPSRSDEADQLLTVEEAARRLGVSKDWVYRRAARLPFTVRLGSALRFSAQGLARYLRQRQGRT
jgi:excisionase family DNA binding protein